MNIYAFFHLNLAFSSIATGDRARVIRRCYEPLLDVAEHEGIPIGVELTGWTLKTIEAIEPAWVERFRRLLHDGKCELIGSGYTQLIGPLVPYAVNRHNQRLGMDVYQRLLGCRPKLALVNEMAFSAGIVPAYKEAGYQAIIFEKENALLAKREEQGQNPENLQALRKQLPLVVEGGGARLPVLWAESVTFQRLQRYVHDEISLGEYREFLRRRCAMGDGPIPIYSGDAEIFDFRPGRFKEEPSAREESKEWAKLAKLFADLPSFRQVRWLLPSAALAARLKESGQWPSPMAGDVTTAKHPILVKKQPKYNVTRWAISGRDDLRLNTGCHRLLQAMEARADEQGNDEAWERLCEFWASDYRTHITAERWEDLQKRLADAGRELGVAVPVAQGEASRGGEPISPDDERLGPLGISITSSHEGKTWEVQTGNLRLSLNGRRGLTVRSLAFQMHGFAPVVGSVAQGYFDSIELGVDWYTDGVVVELPAQHRRVADLVPTTAEFFLVEGSKLRIATSIDTAAGRVHRSYEVDPKEESVVFRTEFVGVERPHGTVRIGHVALHPETLGPHVFYRVTNGGPTPETFPLTVGFMHHEPVSTMVSCRSGLGATEGFVELGNATMGIRAQWDPAQCAAMPVVDFKPCPPSALTRLIFSLCELDETSKPGGGLLPFSFKLSPTQGMGAVHPCQGTRQGKDVTQEEAHGLGDDGPARIDARRTKARP